MDSLSLLDYVVENIGKYNIILVTQSRRKTFCIKVPRIEGISDACTVGIVFSDACTVGIVFSDACTVGIVFSPGN